jgi:hypothetical protein
MILQAQEYQDMPLFENFVPGVQTPKVPVDDQVPPSALDRPKTDDLTRDRPEMEVTGYGGGMY